MYNDWCWSKCAWPLRSHWFNLKNFQFTVPRVFFHSMAMLCEIFLEGRTAGSIVLCLFVWYFIHITCSCRVQMLHDPKIEWKRWRNWWWEVLESLSWSNNQLPPPWQWLLFSFALPNYPFELFDCVGLLIATHLNYLYCLLGNYALNSLIVLIHFLSHPLLL